MEGHTCRDDRVDYWAAGVLAYFDALGQDAVPDDAPHPITTREALKSYDPDLFALVNETMAYDGHVDWRLQGAASLFRTRGWIADTRRSRFGNATSRRKISDTATPIMGTFGTGNGGSSRSACWG